MNFLRAAYPYLPPPARTLAASLRGAYLRSWRYGPETERLIEEALARDSWSAEQWQSYQEERLAYLLHRAATRVPFYREQWAARRRQDDRASYDRLENWPLLNKESLRQQPAAFVADDCQPGRMFREHTSGTTGKPLSVWLSRQTLRTLYALYEARARRWNGVSWRQHWAILGGQQVVPAHVTQPPFWVWNAPLHQLYLSATHLSPPYIRSFVEALNRYRITHLVAYTSAANYLAAEIQRQQLPRPEGLQVVITNAEGVFPWQRETITRTLAPAVRETYGMAEQVATASEAADGRLYLWPEMGHVEVFANDRDEVVPQGRAGRLICTGLLNGDMPLIRYEVGDRGTLAAASDDGTHQMPVLAGLEGRTNDMLIAPDGRRVFWLNPVFYGLPLREAQIVQDALADIRVRYVPAPGFSAEARQVIADRLQARLGEVQVSLEEMAQIPRTPGGKLRGIICNVEPAAVARLDASLAPPD